MSIHSNLPLSLLVTAALATISFAQAPDLSQFGGGTPGTTTWTVDADWFVLPNLRLNLAYVDTDLDIIDGDAVIGSVTARF